MASRGRIQPHWWSKSTAGVVPGLLIAIAVSGILAWVGPHGIDGHPNTRVQFYMWFIPLLWLPIMTTVYLFETGKKAWLWLGSAAVLTHAVLLLIRHLNGAL